MGLLILSVCVLLTPTGLGFFWIEEGSELFGHSTLPLDPYDLDGSASAIATGSWGTSVVLMPDYEWMDEEGRIVIIGDTSGDPDDFSLEWGISYHISALASMPGDTCAAFVSLTLEIWDWQQSEWDFVYMDSDSVWAIYVGMPDRVSQDGHLWVWHMDHEYDSNDWYKATIKAFTRDYSHGPQTTSSDSNFVKVYLW